MRVVICPTNSFPSKMYLTVDLYYNYLAKMFVRPDVTFRNTYTILTKFFSDLWSHGLPLLDSVQDTCQVLYTYYFVKSFFFCIYTTSIRVSVKNTVIIKALGRIVVGIIHKVLYVMQKKYCETRCQEKKREFSVSCPKVT